MLPLLLNFFFCLPLRSQPRRFADSLLVVGYDTCPLFHTIAAQFPTSLFHHFNLRFSVSPAFESAHSFYLATSTLAHDLFLPIPDTHSASIFSDFAAICGSSLIESGEICERDRQNKIGLKETGLNQLQVRQDPCEFYSGKTDAIQADCRCKQRLPAMHMLTMDANRLVFLTSLRLRLRRSINLNQRVSGTCLSSSNNSSSIEVDCNPPGGR